LERIIRHRPWPVESAGVAVMIVAADVRRRMGLRPGVPPPNVGGYRTSRPQVPGKKWRLDRGGELKFRFNALTLQRFISNT
jgi:hypothetical protein